MLEIIPKSKLPKDHKLSSHLMEKYDYYLVIKYFGNIYYFPVGLHERKLMGLSIKQGQVALPSYDKQRMWYNFFQNMIASVYLQTRDTVGAEIEQTLLSNIHDNFDQLLARTLEMKIDKMLPKPPETLRIPNEPLT